MPFCASRLNSAFHSYADAQGKKDSSPTLGRPALKLGPNPVSWAPVGPDEAAQGERMAAGGGSPLFCARKCCTSEGMSHVFLCNLPNTSKVGFGPPILFELMPKPY